jgi:hypothetical protein
MRLVRRWWGQQTAVILGSRREPRCVGLGACVVVGWREIQHPDTHQTITCELSPVFNVLHVTPVLPLVAGTGGGSARHLQETDRFTNSRSKS